MSTTLELGAAPVRLAQGSPRRVVWALARVEGWRLVRNPFFLVSVGFGATLAVLMTGLLVPVLQFQDMMSGLWLLPVAGGTLVAANLAALRGRRHGADELLEPLVATPGERTAAHLLSVLWAVGASFLLLAGVFFWFLVRGAIGSPNVLELLTGPAIVAFGGALGIAVATWWRAVVAGPLAFVASGSIEILLSFKANCNGIPNTHGLSGGGRWLALWVQPSGCGSPPRELLFRPTGAHVLWIVGLVGLVGLLAVGRSAGRAAAPGARSGLMVGFAATLSLVIAAGVLQQRPVPAALRARFVRLALDPERFESCRRRDGVLYCLFPAYRALGDRWFEAIDPVVRRVPSGALSGPVVRQVLGPPFGSDLPPAVAERLSGGSPFRSRPGLLLYDGWGDGGALGEYQLQTALRVAAAAVGLPSRLDQVRLTASDIRRLVAAGSLDPGVKPGTQAPAGCSSIGQARAVVAIWLAAAVSPAAGDALRRLNREAPFGLVEVGRGAWVYSGGPVEPFLGESEALVQQSATAWGASDAMYAEELLALPANRVASTIRANWSTLVDPRTRVSAVVGMFGLRKLPTVRQEARRLGIGPAQLAGPQVEYGSTFVPCRAASGQP